MKTFILFPHQLFEDISILKGMESILIIYEELFFNQFNFHKTKLAFHFATTRFYNDYLINNGLNSKIIELKTPYLFENFFKELAEKDEQLFYYDTVDYLLERRIRRFTEKYNIKVSRIENPSFLLSNVLLDKLKPANNKYFQTDFYIKIRKEFDILLEYGKPIGGKWSFDNENRKKIPRDIIIPKQHKFPLNKFRNEGIEYVLNNYPNNYGEFALEYYPINHSEAIYLLEKFLEIKFINFGIYQDGILRDQTFNFHSILSSSINIGLITPLEVIKKTLDFAEKNKIPINSIEGFIRQIIGWREFIRMVYIQKGVYQRTRNYFNYTANLNKSYWTGNVGIAPLDDSIKKTLQFAYTHHIERLMILGNFMLLSEIKPDEVYNWFMSLYIDAYDWVMVPNVYGMSQYADGGLITTKPYISGSNYIIKMSDYKKGEWSEIWDALYWNFIFKNKDKFSTNPRMTMMIALLNNMDNVKLMKLIKLADGFLK